MNGNDDRKLSELLKAGVTSVRTEPARDLWPEMLRRMDRVPRRVPWFDWVLAAAAVGCLILFPQLIPALLNHL